MPTENEINVFKNQILARVGDDVNLRPTRYRVPLTGFLAVKGNNYPLDGGGLMVVGRSLNGWPPHINPNDLNDIKLRHQFVDEVHQESTGEDGNCPMSWVTDQWGGDRNSSTRRSAFWRVIKEVVIRLEVENFDENIWSSYLVWSNLYKVSPRSEGNLSETLCKAQKSGCIELLRVEFETYRPERLLFLTGYGWARPFLEAFTMNYSQMPEEINQRFVEKFGQLTLPNEQMCKIVIAHHPQGKGDDPWIENVMQAFHILDGEAI